MPGEKCPIDLQPMATWVQEEDPKGICRECLLGPVLQWYRETLNEKGHSNLTDELNKIARAAEVLPLQLCEEFDKIKVEVEESLRERLLEFDCAAQTYNPDDDS